MVPHAEPLAQHSGDPSGAPVRHTRGASNCNRGEAARCLRYDDKHLGHHLYGLRASTCNRGEAARRLRYDDKHIYQLYGRRASA